LYGHNPHVESGQRDSIRHNLLTLWKCKWTFIRKWPVENVVLKTHQISINLAKQFERRRFKEIDQPETRIAYGSHVC
jgi:hypothetical protein